MNHINKRVIYLLCSAVVLCAAFVIGARMDTAPSSTPANTTQSGMTEAQRNGSAPLYIDEDGDTVYHDPEPTDADDVRENAIEAAESN